MKISTDSENVNPDLAQKEPASKRLVRLCADFVLFCAIVFFVYCAYEGTFQGGGSNQVFTGFGILLVVLFGRIGIDKTVLEKNQEKKTDKRVSRLDVE